MPRYRRTKIILPPKGRPLDVKDLIKRAVQIEEAKDVGYIQSAPKLPVKATVDALKPSPGLYAFYRGILKVSQEFLP